MAVPKFYDFMPFVLKVMADSQIKSRKQIRESLIPLMNLTEDDINELLESKIETVFQNRSNWAIQYLFKAGFLTRPKRAHYLLSELGKNYIENNGFELSLDDLYKFDSFKEFMRPQKNEIITHEEDEISDITPEEKIEEAFQILNQQLKSDLLDEVLSMEPVFFEHLVLDLLVKMGYGGKDQNSIVHTPLSNDGGIDGLIKEDALGLEYIYVQAKRWAPGNNVSRPEIQSFVGALSGHGASKGVFITTSKFSNHAIEYAKLHLNSKIVLIDGNRLTELMIAYGVGVSISQTYFLKKIDTDYFNTDN